VYDDPDMDSVNLLPVLHVLLNSHEPLDLLILMLGTNDSKVKFNTDARKIAKGMHILLEEAKSVPCWGKNGPKILIVAPVPIEEGVILMKKAWRQREHWQENMLSWQWLNGRIS
jgi:lysophospholipase L1-like esterase